MNHGITIKLWEVEKKNLTVLAWRNCASAVYMDMNRHGRIIFGNCPLPR
jgi:hypothetical protein